VTGDPNQRHDLDGLPLLGPLLFVPFAIGIWRAWQWRGRAEHALLLTGLLVFMLPPLIATEGAAPHFLRSLGLAPYVAGVLGIGTAELVRTGAAAAGRRGASLLAPSAAAVALAVLGALSLRAYLDRPVSHRYDDFFFAGTALAAAAAGGPGTVAIV